MKYRNLNAVALTVLVVSVFGTACTKTASNGAQEKSSAPRKVDAAPAEKIFQAGLPEGLVVPDKSDEVRWRLLSEYGAVFVARGGAVPPPFIVFPDANAVDSWQSSIRTMQTDFGGTLIELQTSAMTALIEARAEAKKAGLNISPRDLDSGRRSYEETVRLWESRITPGLTHWTQSGRLDREDAERIRILTPLEQIPEILRLEDEGLYFSKDFSKSILYSVAAPGTSQHLSMLAFDVRENEDPAVRAILARHGWFQTVSSDTPHFTFMGVTENELPSLGLKKVTAAGRPFWIPNLD